MNHYQSFNRIPKGIVMAIVLLLTAQFSHAQIPAKQDGNSLNFFDTAPFGGQNGHIQSGSFGTFGPNDRWIGIGQPSGTSTSLYGMRIQDAGQVGTLSINEDGGTGIKDLELQWGLDPQSRFRLNFLPSLFGPELNIMTAQSSGRIGINEDTPDNFASRLVVNGSTPDQDNFGLFVQNEFLAASYHRGKSYGIICSSADNTGGASYGVFSSANGSSAASANTFGLYGRSIASNNSQNVGVYGVVTGSGTNNYAGYFAGDVLVTGAFTSSSDRRLKKDIQIESKVMDKLMKVRPSTYEYRQDGKFSEMNLDEGAQHGFIAQELEEVFPELVKESVFTFGLPNSGESGDFQPSAGEPFDFKSVNYQAMIPILTKGIQEQQSTILDQKELILGLTEKVEQLEQIIVQSLGKQRNDFMNSTSKGNVLYQNSPNPFDVVTEIRYELAANIRSAEMIVFDMNGRQVRKFSNLSPGSGSIQLEGNQLESGMYLYSLLVDGQEIDTKRMILTE